MQHLPDAFAPLAAYRQWILWTGNKLPVNAQTGEVSNAHDPAIWLSAEEAIAAAARAPGTGVGFVFTEADPFFFLDIDHCLAPDRSNWSPLALDLCGRFSGAAVEISQSGEGLHIIGTGQAPAHACKNIAAGLELYTAGRFVALTGNGAIGSAATDCSAPLAVAVAQYFPARNDNATGAEWTTGPVPEWDGIEDDDTLIERAINRTSARATFGGSAAFRDLWAGNVEALAAAYPTDDDRPYDGSSADAALAQHLAFWTGKDCDRMRRIMMRSALVRDKWDREDYLPRTITRACAMCSTVYSRPAKEQEPPPESVEPAAPMGDDSNGPVIRAGTQYLAPTQQIEHFAGCVYVRDAHAVLTPDGTLLDQGRFRSVYGGYTFALDSANGKTTKNAWEAFVESQAVSYPKAAATMFRPDLTPGAIFDHQGQRLVNNYIEIPVRREPGDPSRFLDHLARLLPNERDRAILMAYMAACVQHKGVKFQWWPLIQGVEGNGKTLFSRVVAEAIGDRYVHTPKAEKISADFNSWIKDKIFIYVEDVYLPDGKREVFEALKPIITNDRQAVEPKGVDQKTEYVVANGMLNSNHKDAIRKTKNDRRIAPFFTAQQEKEDKDRDGLTREYFRDLYDWLKGRAAYAAHGEGYGYAVIAEYLATYPIPDELNPATGQDAPHTSSTDEAVTASMGGVEQEVLEAIEEGRPGFAGGWISSMALDRLLDSLRATRQIPPSKRRDLLRGLGYDWHPALENGRVHNPVPPDNGKTRLYIRAGHIHANLTQPAEVARKYSEAQAATANASATAVFGAGG